MTSANGMVFIDACKYLDLYGMGSEKGKELLAALVEQQNYIFVTAQVVDEVQRNKVRLIAKFLAREGGKLEESKLNTIAIPDHLISDTDNTGRDVLKRFRESVERVGETRGTFTNLAHRLLELVSQSKDEVSKALAPVFSQAVQHSGEELQRARMRREFGNPPGKEVGPLGDQLSWEQILSRWQDNRSLWIITKDSDYAIKYGGKMFLNAALYLELAQRSQSTPEVFCFDNIAEGLQHFVKTTRVPAHKLPMPEEIEQIKKEEESLPLPPLDWLPAYDDAAMTAILGGLGLRDPRMLEALMTGQIPQKQAIPPRQPNGPGKST